jgi:Ice-binding-like
MKFPRYARNASRVRFGVASVAAVALLVALPGNAQAAAVPVPLGTAGSFVVLAGAGVTNTGRTTLHGDLGTFPTTTITGAPVVTGTNHHGDAVTKRAKTSLVTAYNVAAGEGPTSPIAGDLTGRTLTRGVYNSASSILLTGRLTLSGSGPFVFQAGSALTTGSGSQINLINGARSCNVFWQIGSSATLGTGSRFVGTIMALSSITATTGANVVGRLLARNGAVTLDTNVITRPTPCATTGGTTATGGTGSQVGQVPTGGVSSGDGSTSGGGNRSLALLSSVLVFAGFGSAALAVTRRRRRVNI